MTRIEAKIALTALFLIASYHVEAGWLLYVTLGCGAFQAVSGLLLCIQEIPYVARRNRSP